MCGLCRYSATITATDAKRMYGLGEEVLARLPVWQYTSKYHAAVRKFLRADVEGEAEAAYGSCVPAEIREQRRGRRGRR